MRRLVSETLTDHRNAMFSHSKHCNAIAKNRLLCESVIKPCARYARHHCKWISSYLPIHLFTIHTITITRGEQRKHPSCFPAHCPCVRIGGLKFNEFCLWAAQSKHTGPLAIRTLNSCCILGVRKHNRRRKEPAETH